MYLIGQYYHILLAAAILPPAVALFIVRRMDRAEPEPMGLLIRLFLRGLVGMVPIMLLEMLAQSWVEGREWSRFTYYFLCYFCIPGVIEEGVKYWMLKRTTWRLADFDYTFDAVVYAVFVSMGFAAVENILYVTGSGMTTAVARALSAIPGHASFGVFMGYYYAKAKELEIGGGDAKLALARAWAVPMVLHGLYDFLLVYYGSGVFIAYFAVLAFFAVKTARKAAKNDRPLYPPELPLF